MQRLSRLLRLSDLDRGAVAENRLADRHAALVVRRPLEVVTEGLGHGPLGAHAKAGPAMVAPLLLLSPKVVLTSSLLVGRNV